MIVVPDQFFRALGESLVKAARTRGPLTFVQEQSLRSVADQLRREAKQYELDGDELPKHDGAKLLELIRRGAP